MACCLGSKPIINDFFNLQRNEWNNRYTYCMVGIVHQSVKWSTESMESVERVDNIQLMHSFEVNIRICQPSKVMSNKANRESDVHRGEAEVDITFEG